MSAAMFSSELVASVQRMNARAANPEILAGYLSGEILTAPARSQHNRAQRRYEGRFSRSRYQRSPDRDKSRQRRGTLASTWPMPPRMCGMITEAQRAYAKIVADEVARTGDCRLTLDEIAARGGMSRKTAKRAQDRLDTARVDGLGWITVEIREVAGRKNLPNIIRITSGEWLTWIEMGPTVKRGKTIGGHSRPQRAEMSCHGKPVSEEWCENYVGQQSLDGRWPADREIAASSGPPNCDRGRIWA